MNRRLSGIRLSFECHRTKIALFDVSLSRFHENSVT
jgi:hypothetical protein